MNTNLSMHLESQLLTTKFFMPVASGTLISRLRLTALLQQSLEYPLTLISAPAGFGKTTLLSAWGQALPAKTPKLAWVSLDEEDNELRLFWTYVVTALNMLLPDRFSPLLTQLQSPQPPLPKYIVTTLINALVEGTEQFLLILDDYHLITDQEVHSSLSYLLEHLPIQLHIIVSTRTDPPLSLSQLRARQQLLEVRTDQLRCTPEETRTFFDEAMDTQLPDETIQQVMARTEGWLVGLQLLRLSLPERTDPLSLLEEISGDQRYILDYLTEEVLRRQPQEVQMFLLSTSILERLSASLCDAVMQQTGSQQMLQRLEKANLFVVSLDSKRQWYRYHALFAEALAYQLEQTSVDLVFALHHRASLWYAQHDRSTQAILHAFRAKEWQWAADLIEQKSLQVLAMTWGAGEHELVIFQQWLEQLPVEVMGSRPRLCLACAQMMWQVAPHAKLEAWLNAAEATLTTLLTTQTHEVSYPTLTSATQQELEDRLGEVIAWRGVIQSHGEDGQTALALCEQALTLLSPENFAVRAFVGYAQLRALYVSATNDALASVQTGLQAGSLALAAGHTTLAIGIMGATALYMVGPGRLHELQRLTQQAMQLGTQAGGAKLPEVGWPATFLAETLRQWNELDAALSLSQEAITLSQQTTSLGMLTYVILGYSVLLRIYLSRGELDAALSALQQFERISKSMNQPISLHLYSFFTAVDQVRLWLACGDLDRATNWAQQRDVTEPHGTPFAREREEVACIRILLAKAQPANALERLEHVLQRATTGQRWNDVIEIRLLQALAHQMLHETTSAFKFLSEAVRLAEPEGYIRSFADEGAPMETLLYRLRKRDRKHGPTPYLDTLLAAFQQESIAHARAGEPAKAQPLPEPLSERELQVLQLLARGTSNQEIAQELVIVIDTVKSHISRIFSKLGVQNRVQAVRQAQELGLLDEES